MRARSLLRVSVAVMEAAFFLIEAGVLNVPLTGKANVKQSRALLHIAAWLQTFMSQSWTENGNLCPHPATESAQWQKLLRLMMALMGPAGTGKTTVVKVSLALCEHFLGDDSTVKSAPTNTAARLFGGDTCHSWWKLPPKSLRGKNKFLSRSVLEQHQQRWKNKSIEFIDEISMHAPEQLHQGDMRKRAAKRKFNEYMGGVASVTCGDMLQLPPVILSPVAVLLIEGSN